jgi:sporulation protein YlmC with PRC-barrel domain
MLGKLTGASLLVLGTLAMPAMAQNNTQTTNPNPPAAATQEKMATTQTQSGQNAQFMTQASQDDWRASKLVGVNIYGSNNEKIGDVNDVLIDRGGQAKAVIIGVGGFLGIGEKNVAIPFDRIEWVMTDARTANASGNVGASNSTVANANNATMNNSAAGTSNMTGSTATRTTNDVTGSTAAGTANSTSYRGYPDHGVLRMTKADLQSAPSFHWSNNQ